MVKAPEDAPRALDLVPSTPEFDAGADALIALIASKQSFVVMAHERPDGDAIGSTLAFGRWLEELGKDVRMVNVDPAPYNFTFLPGADTLRHDMEGSERPDVTIVLDCAARSRVGERMDERAFGEHIVVVDHHKTWDPDFASVYVRDPSAAATGEVIYRVMARAGATVSPEVGACLYCCLLTDTGSFRYSSASKATFQIAGELVEAGVDPWDMTSHIYESQPFVRLDLLARVLPTVRLASEGRIAFLKIDDAMFEETGAERGMEDGFINYARGLAGVEVAAQLTQGEGDRWRVSFRSKGAVDVSVLAECFGGGGHRNAAGCTVAGEFNAIADRLAESLTQMLEG